MKVLNIIKKIAPFIICALAVVAIVMCVFQIISFSKNNRAGTNIFEAVFNPSSGKKAGLSAVDTEQEIKNTVSELSNLEVLVANVKIPEYHTVDDKYTATYLFRGSAVFTVDLSKMEVKDNENEVIVDVPKPVADIRIDNKQTEKQKERTRIIFNGSTEEGIESYINTLKMVDKVSSEKISNYSELIEHAKGSTRKHVEEIIKNICGSEKKVTIRFIEE